MMGMESSARAVDEAALLEDLKHVPGVFGSMLISPDGMVLRECLPPVFAERASDAALRLVVLLDALSGGRQLQAYCLRFFEHRLHVLPVACGFLCVLSELEGAAAILKMAMNVTARRLS
jgi:predicted regulator of Ras-like GTPase activity (Roadblock/LC7/MglB family)